MMLLRREELEHLFTSRARPSLSIFMPTHRAGAEVQQDPIRLKNMLRLAEDRLVATGVRAREARALLEAPAKLLQDDLFWRHQQDGLALFVSPSLFSYYRLPLPFAELLVVTDRFHVKPLLPLFASDARFFLLALSQNHVRLFEGTRDSIAEVPLDRVPRNLADALKYDVLEKQTQVHSGARTGTGGIFHGQAIGSENIKEQIRRYFQQIDRGLRQLLRDERVPLVLAGVDYLLPMYREVSTYAHLLAVGLEGNPDLLKSRELHERAWKVLEPYVRQKELAAAAQYRELAGASRTSNKVEEVVPAAHHGRVETLFVAVGVQRWGRFDPAADRVEIAESPDANTQDLLDLAGTLTILHKGTVFPVGPGQVPDQGPIAAVFRY